MTERSCAERIADHMEGREDLIGSLRYRQNSDDRWKSEEADEELNMLPLAVETKRTVEILLSTGGPADGLRVLVGDNGPERVTYWFSDWFDHAETNVDEGSHLWNYATELAEMMLEGES